MYLEAHGLVDVSYSGVAKQVHIVCDAQVIRRYYLNEFPVALGCVEVPYEVVEDNTSDLHDGHGLQVIDGALP